MICKLWRPIGSWIASLTLFWMAKSKKFKEMEVKRD